MFAAGNHTVMGSAEDPKDGKSVATAVFGAVVIYGVSSANQKRKAQGRPSREVCLEHVCCDCNRWSPQANRASFLLPTGLPPLLRQPGIPPQETDSRRRDRTAVKLGSQAEKCKSAGQTFAIARARTGGMFYRRRERVNSVQGKLLSGCTTLFGVIMIPRGVHLISREVDLLCFFLACTIRSYHGHATVVGVWLTFVSSSRDAPAHPCTCSMREHPLSHML